MLSRKSRPLTGMAGVSPAFVECRFVRVLRFKRSLSDLQLEAGETPAVPVIAISSNTRSHALKLEAHGPCVRQHYPSD